MNNVDINFEKLSDLVAIKDEIEKKNYMDNHNLRTEKDVINIQGNETSHLAVIHCHILLFTP